MKKNNFILQKMPFVILKIFVFIFSYLLSISLPLFFLTSQPFQTIALGYETTKISYAKVGDSCTLYRTSSMSDDLSNIFFYVPETYFVTIISKISDQIYKVQYEHYTGFCYAINLSIVSFEPNVSTLSGITFDITSTAGTQIWSVPSDTKGIKQTTIPAGTSQIEYIASAKGDIPLGGTVDLWYYARYTPTSSSTTVYEGYVYSEGTINLTNIPNNLEVESIPETPNFDNTLTINDTLKVVLICLISLPFLVLFAISLVKAHKQIKHKKKEKSTNNTNTISVKPIRTNNTTSFIRKKKSKPNLLEPEDVDQTIEVVFPEYDYIDDDDLL